MSPYIKLKVLKNGIFRLKSSTHTKKINNKTKKKYKAL
ncbi:hypothetical protein BBU29805_0178 [Borreliella burgdorferi 29805]|uniref:Uncharacterized protein n=3 Tax=Borreliella TaxID=64895 RepID=A0A7U8I4Y5_BORBG|nr:hypothetical protein BbuZS7_0171 [Borreliella burgdorferi ZS7]EEC21442.1 hypothetical protein Bbu156a_0709 [Borreliella burgdorferi 156a]EEE18810.1 hypothetical protein BBU72A_0174 [Borreliella burgdorferi 72a]EEF56399.1 hypothetical protein BBU64B_0177 [Borreliella burgdorferi 64b]EEF82606.1 hypothetical protein BBUWI9123_0188 [Borreliella burgdorferi WI91-23]EEG99049.1 hypothetical protein BBU118A_0174 [Borreliella burgdorferi 118a]EEH00242.1 hypothetical protein BBU94A_0173 [Borreliella